MSSSAVETNPLAREVEVTDAELIVTLADGRKLSVPLVWFPRLLHATAEQRRQWEFLGDGEGVHWPLIDEDLSVEGLLAGRPSRSRARPSPSAAGGRTTPPGGRKAKKSGNQGRREQAGGAIARAKR